MSVVTPFQSIQSEKNFSELKNLLLDYPDLTQNADSQCWDMLAGAKLQNIESKSILFHENMVCEYFMLIVEGCIRVFKESDEGREVTLYRVEPGQLCIHNLNSLVDGIQYPVIARAEKPVRGLIISRAVFKKALDESSSFRNYVLRTLTGRLSH
ncbi:MAG: cyclic nucleotide-binding domain-containing protein, partial [Gammaproteobacteria bacterium]|nr:cyclic nucleotide-binding domain-containing protein [Gammaproteobacteria bacterium]